MIKQSNWWRFAHKKEPNIRFLKQILEDDNLNAHYNKNQIKAIQLKYKAMIAEPIVIEKTMSPEQLFNTQNPLWARGYTIQELYYWFQYRKPFDSFKQVDTIVRSSEKLDKAIKKYNSSERK